MKKYTVMLLAAVLCISIIGLPVIVPEPVLAADHVMKQEITDGPGTPSEDNAYIIFRDTPKMNKMSFEDGVGTDRYTNETYNEKVLFGGVQARQVWKENYLYMRFDKGFASPEDSVFRVDIDYWDYSGIGWFFLDYTTADSDTAYGRVSVLKEGDPDGESKWHHLTIYLTDASFRHVMPYGCDLKIVTNAFNAFSKIEVTNLCGGEGDSVKEIGIFNIIQADALHYLNLYDGIGSGEYNPGLAEYMTKQEFITEMYKSASMEETVLAENAKPSLSGVSKAYAPFVGYAQKTGIINKDEIFEPEDKLTEAEMLIYYMRLLGIAGDFEADPYRAARECGLILGNEVVFQMKKQVTRDNFVGIAANALLVARQGRETILFELMSSKRITGQDISNCGYGKYYDFIITRGFYNGAREIVDEDTGRAYYAVDLLGKDAIKNYFTMPLTSADDTRFYLRDEMFRIYEYNMETGMVRYIDRNPHRREHCFMTTPDNYLFYLNEKMEFIRMDCDTYEKTKVGELPEIQKNSGANMLQASFDGSKISVNWKDQSGDFDNTIYSRFPVLDTTTGEWDMSVVYGDFSMGWRYPNHNAINPVYTNLQFFAHEGLGVLDRVWIVDMDKGVYQNVSKQREYNIGTVPGESVCHEFWCYCGKHIGWITSKVWAGRRSVSSSRVGFVMANWDGSDRKYINDDYSYNHGSISPDHRWAVSDTQLAVGSRLNLVLIDTITGASYLLARPRSMDNPGHTHPQFSWDGKKVFFGLPSDDYSTVNVGWMDISDIVEQPLPSGGEYELSETCSTFGYEGFEHYIEPKEDAQGTYYHIGEHNKMHVNVKHTVTEDRNAKVAVRVTYLDKGKSNLNVAYCKYEVIGSVVRQKECNQYIMRKNTGKWKTEEFVLENADLQNPFKMGADFLISGMFTDADIRSVDVRVLE